MISSETSRGTERRWWLLAAASSAVAIAAMIVEARYLQTMSRHGTGVFPWELAGTTDTARDILVRWGEVGRSAARASSWIDFAFILGYTGLLLALARASQRAAVQGRSAETLVTVTAGLAIGAGAANIAAKIVQLLMLGFDTAQPLPAFGLAAAVANYILLLGAVGGCVVLLALRWGRSQRVTVATAPTCDEPGGVVSRRR